MPVPIETKWNIGKEFGLGWLEYGARWYDASIGRFTTIDRFAEKYQPMTPYQYGANNPILFIDINGDSLNVSDLQSKNKPAAVALESGLESATGLNLSTDVSGNVSFEKEKGIFGISRAKVTKDSKGKKVGSRSARKALKKTIKSSETISVLDNTGGGNYVYTGSNDIHFDVAEISMLQGMLSPGLDKSTFGPGLVFLHELNHTDLGGGHSDGSASKQPTKAGPTARRVNRIRRQLGKNYGVRAAYGFHTVGGASYMPFSRKSLRQLKKGKVPTSNYLKY